MAGAKNGSGLHPTTLDLAQGANFVAITTAIHRQKFKNAERDPRVTLTILDDEDLYHYAEVRGEVIRTVRGQEARDDLDGLSRKYSGQPYPEDQIKTGRVTLWIVPSRQTAVGSGPDEGSPTD